MREVSGSNLQAASAVVNFEPPWNPARLEQRIGRVHRLGQSRPVHVIHMLTTDSIEERVWETLTLKKSLFAGVFDSPTGEVSFAKLGRKTRSPGGEGNLRQSAGKAQTRHRPSLTSSVEANGHRCAATGGSSGTTATAAKRLTLLEKAQAWAASRRRRPA